MNGFEIVFRTRPNECRELLKVLQKAGPAGVVVLGDVGMGKTSLVNGVLASSGFHEPTMTLYCTPTLSDVPYGVLSPYLGGLDRIDEPVKVLRELNRQFVAVANQGETPIIVIEDAQYLDEQSCFVLSLLIENSDVKIVAIGHGTMEVDEPLSVLVQHEAFSIQVLKPLVGSGVQIVAEAVLSCKLGSSTVRLIELATGGNPLLIEKYVASCRDQGTIFRDNTLQRDEKLHETVWVIAEALPAIDERLLAVGREITRYFSEAEMQTMLLVASTREQPVQVLEQCNLPYRRLAKAGEIVLRDGVLSLKSKLIQRIIKSLATEQEITRLHGLWSDATKVLGRPTSAWEVLWCLEIGQELPIEDVYEAALSAANEHQFSLALRLCILGRFSQLHERGALLEAHVQLTLGRHHAARALLLRLVQQITDLELLGRVYGCLLDVATCIDVDSSELDRILRDWQHQVEGHADKEQGEKYLEILDSARKLFSLWVRMNSAKGTTPSVEEFQEFLAHPHLTSRARIIGLLALSDRQSALGYCQQALYTLESATQLLTSDAQLQALYEVRVFFRVGWNLLFLGDNDRAQQHVEAKRNMMLHDIQRFQGAVSLLDGLNHFLQGRKHLSLSKIAEAITELRIADIAQLLGLAINLYYLILVRNGESTLAVENIGPHSSSLSGMISTTGQLGKDSSEQRIFARAIAAALGQPYPGESVKNFPLIEREVLFDDARQKSDVQLTNSTLHGRLQELAGSQEGKRAWLLGRLIQLRLQAHGEPLEDLASEALATKDYLSAIEAWARAGERHSESGDQRRCGAVLRRTATLIEQQQVVPGKHVSRILAMTELTAREIEIVDLARQGLNNAHIARALTVSQRTVEGHLYRVFSKLGITERSELNHASLDAIVHRP